MIDDEVEIGEFIAIVAQTMDFRCISVTNTADFIAMLSPEVTLIMIDLMMPEMDGIELLRLLGKLSCKAWVVLMSEIEKRALETADELAKSLGLSVVGQLQKPFRVEELKAALRSHEPVGALPAFTDRPPLAVTECDLQRAIRTRRIRASLSGNRPTFREKVAALA